MKITKIILLLNIQEIKTIKYISQEALIRVHHAKEKSQKRFQRFKLATFFSNIGDIIFCHHQGVHVMPAVPNLLYLMRQSYKTQFIIYLKLYYSESDRLYQQFHILRVNTLISWNNFTRKHYYRLKDKLYFDKIK